MHNMRVFSNLYTCARLCMYIYTDGNITIMIPLRFLDPTLIRRAEPRSRMCAALIDEFDYFNLPGLSVGVKL